MTYLRIQRAADTNQYYADAVSQLPGYQHAWTVARQATQRLEHLAGPDRDPLPSPLDTGDITDSWLDQQVEDNAADAELTRRRIVLAELREHAHNRVTGIVATHGDTILAALHDVMLDIVDRGNDLCRNLGAARTAAAAITAGTAATTAWAGLAHLHDDYRAVRAAQVAVMVDHPDHAARAHSSDNPDSLASDLLLANLDTLCPQWRHPAQGYTGASLWSPPWPADAVEQFVWLCSSDAEPWIPTCRQLDRLWAGRAPAAHTTAPHPAPPRGPSVHGTLNRTLTRVIG